MTMLVFTLMMIVIVLIFMLPFSLFAFFITCTTIIIFCSQFSVKQNKKIALHTLTSFDISNTCRTIAIPTSISSSSV